MLRVSHSVFDPEALSLSIARAYRMPGAVNCTLVSPGVNDTYEVVAGPETYFFRVYRAGLRSRSDIEFELALLRHLQSEGIPVSVPVPRADGSYVTSLPAPEGERPAVLFTRAPGKVLEYVEDDAFQYGCAVARLHTAMDGLQSDWARFRLDMDHLLEQPLRLILPYAGDHRDFYSGLADRLRSRVQAVESELEVGLCHGDLHGHNVHKDGDGRLTLFDFDCGGPGYRAYDLAVYRWAVGRHAKDMRPWDAFVSGYRTIREIGQADLDITVPFVGIRVFWLLGLQVQQVNQRGTGWVSMWIDGAAQFLRRFAEAELRE